MPAHIESQNIEAQFLERLERGKYLAPITGVTVKVNNAAARPGMRHEPAWKLQAVARRQLDLLVRNAHFGRRVPRSRVNGMDVLQRNNEQRRGHKRRGYKHDTHA
jgi:hypothetical protein